MKRQTIISWKTSAPFYWDGQDVVVVASGPSARAADFSGRLHGRVRVIAVNSSWRLVPWADALYASDGKFWDVYKGVPEFEGRKFASSPRIAEKYGLDLVFAAGNSSGLRAIHLAHALRAGRILLIGFDMHDRDGTHWHEPHPKELFNPSKASMMLWRTEIEMAVATSLKGVEIINCTPGSDLKDFPIMMLEEALNGNVGVEGRANKQRDCVAFE